MADETYKKELDSLEQIKAVSDLPGVKAIQKISEQAALSSILILSNSYAEKTHEQLISLCATLRANLEIMKTISGVDKDIEVIKELIVEEEKQNPPEPENT